MSAELPRPTDDVTSQLDWIEWHLIQEGRDFISWAEYRKVVLMGGVDSQPSDDDDRTEDDRLELDRLIDEIGAEVTIRRDESGGTVEGYPYDADRSGVHRTLNAAPVYEFLLALALNGKDAGAPPPGDRLFEDVSTVALREYLGGGARGAEAVAFGFPRRVLPTAFPAAVRDLCQRLREGTHNDKEPKAIDQKDAKLDVVGWSPFPDLRHGKLIVFGQCATGRNWQDKQSELQPLAWQTAWLYSPPAVLPVRAFFVPFRPPIDDWRVIAINAGIIFDRCRISWLSSQSLPDELKARLRAWVEAASGTQMAA